ncbi:hypothetical protein [Microbispora rosea]|uniref:hypothetical protein n=1 Tax=Microbispora rosea TaxID=58117 RepID=UPI000A7EA0F7|nr:hypothetical protein [Microbispora rosea]
MTGDLRRALLLAAEEQEEYHIACPCPQDHAAEADRLRAQAYALPPISVALSPAGSHL